MIAFLFMFGFKFLRVHKSQTSFTVDFFCFDEIPLSVHKITNEEECQIHVNRNEKNERALHKSYITKNIKESTFNDLIQ